MIERNWRSLIRPEKLGVEIGADAQRSATIVAEPLERGFGMTLGNALRRVLLSSLQGAAVTSIRIENVLHEFSSLAGVREDVTDIVLNVKQIALRMQGAGPKRLQLSATGPAEVKAGDIAVSGDIARFRSPSALAAAAGLAPVLRQSGRSHALRRARRGDRDLKRVLYLSAFSACASHPESRAYYDRKRREGKHHAQALIALARRRADVLWAMLVRDRAYDPGHRATHSAQRAA